MYYSLPDYRRRVLGCFLGKNAGGTLGMRDEWHRRINHVDDYTHLVNGEPLPNDDMDIQLVWLIALEEKGIYLDAKILGDYFMYYVTPHWAEYGNCKVNMRLGLQPPFSGTVNNPYTDSCGAYIRSEIWACLAPGCPSVAAAYAYQDALIDHGEGEGLYAEVFCAAMESAAFIIEDIDTLLAIGLSYIPKDCAVAKAVRLTIDCHNRKISWQETRDELLSQFLGGFIFSISDEDNAKGFTNGKVGWEAPSNIGLIVLSLLYGEKDFGKTICLAVNCGEDTDCTAATAGSLLGILLGMDGIDEKWAKPIGTNLKTACLNLGELGNLGNLLPKNIYELQQRIEKLALWILPAFHTGIQLTEQTLIEKNHDICSLNMLCENQNSFYIGKYTSRFCFDFFNIDVTYEDGITVTRDSEKKITFTVHNKYKTPENLFIKLYCNGVSVSPAPCGILHVPEGVWLGNQEKTSFTFGFGEITETLMRCVAEFTTNSHAGVMLVPLFFLHDITGPCNK